MKLQLVALSALLLTACDVREKITGRATEPDRATGDFWEIPLQGGGVPRSGGVVEDYGTFQPTYLATANPSEYHQTANMADYIPPTPPAPVITQDEEPEDTLLVPKRAAPTPAPAAVAPKQDLIKVAPGDTLYSISRKYNVPLRDLITSNKLEAPYALKPGQTLYMPSQFVHTVAKGETLYSISRLYQMDTNSLATMNSLKEPYSLKVGQKLILPAQIQLTDTKSPSSGEGNNKSSSDLIGGSRPTSPAPVAGGGMSGPAGQGGGNVPAAEPTRTPEPKVVKKSTPVSSLAKAPARSSSKFAWPIRGTILSPFGAKPNGLYNDGINIKGTKGAPVSAAENGVVAYAGNEIKGLGNLVIIKHADGFMSVYAHLDTILVERGKQVSVGAKIGSVGQTGKVNSPQLHFEVRKGTKAFNPTSYLR
ncbi:MAG: LysM peptidoglycan-binding domain-containing M23 family metallopeptidase [Rickettsiales bacterium]|nr:LysM peptidoglycan-binding domain-containing M23 family metallopeptidase [Rickettsiales bacterium]